MTTEENNNNQQLHTNLKDNELKIFTWNVRSMNHNQTKAESLQQLIKAIEVYKIDVLALQEIRWCGSGLEQQQDYRLYYIGESRVHKFGTGFLVNNKLQSSQVIFEAISSRICMLHIALVEQNVSIINVHAPTEGTTSDPNKHAEKEAFYVKLEQLYDSCPKQNIKMIIGDMNAQIGKELALRRQVGTNSLHEFSNNNGLRIVNFAASKGMIVRSTMLARKNIHKWTWKSEDKKTKNQIDHILIDAPYKACLLNVRSYRGADIHSDHYLLGTTLRIRKKRKEKQEVRIINQSKLTNFTVDAIKECYQQQLDANLTAAMKQNACSAKKWTILIAAMQHAAKQVLNNTTIRELTKATLFESYFEHNATQSNVIETTNPPSNEELENALSKLNTENFAANCMEIPVILFKYLSRQVFEQLLSIIVAIWDSERLPRHWQTAISMTTKSLQAIEHLNSVECRALTQLDVFYDILANILCAKLRPYAQAKLQGYNGDLSQICLSSIEHIFMFRQALEKTSDRNIGSYHLLIGFKQNFKTIDKNELIKTLLEFDVPEKLVSLLRIIISKTNFTLQTQPNNYIFEACKEPKQGDPLANILFSFLLEQVLRQSKINRESTILEVKSVQVLSYGVELHLMGESLRRVESIFEQIQMSVRKIGLIIDETATKLLLRAKRRLNEKYINLNGLMIEVVSEFNYIGVNINSDNKLSLEIDQRILLANECYFKVYKYLKSTELQSANKLKIYHSIIRPILTYACETWTDLYQAEIIKLKDFELKVLRSIGCDTRELRGRHTLQNHTDIITFIKCERLYWASHIANLSNDCMLQKIYLEKPAQKRKNSQKCWKDAIFNDAQKLGINDWETEAQDQCNWMARIDQVKKL